MSLGETMSKNMIVEMSVGMSSIVNLSERVILST